MKCISCNLCKSNDYIQLYRLVDHQFHRSDIAANYVVCNKCGLIYQNPMPEIEEILKYYPLNYDLYNPNIYSQKSPLKTRIIQYGLTKRINYILSYVQKGRILDIGCATGKFLSLFAKHPDWETYGVETSTQAAQLAKELYGINVHIGQLEDAHYPSNFFDAITLWDVLEHLPDPMSSLTEINRILKPEGILVFRVPDYDSWDSKLFQKYWAGFEPPRHLYVFKKDTIIQYLISTNFHMIKLDYRIGTYPTFVFNILLWMSAHNYNQNIRNIVDKVLNHPFARIITSPIFFLVSVLGKGSLVTVVAKK